MSWIIGIKGKASVQLSSKLASLLPPKHVKAKTKELQVYCGGLDETTCFDKANNDAYGFMVCGMGIITENDRTRFMTLNDWQKIVSGEIRDIRRLNGHFTGVTWSPTATILFTHMLGLREMYITRTKEVVMFSTRLNWLTRLLGNCHIDFEQFSTVWLSFNQLSRTSAVSGIERLGGGCIAFLESNNLTYKRESWLPDISQASSSDQVIENIKKFALFPLIQNRRISLGLSGGVDSRVLLTILSNHSHNNWGLHIFGDKSHPDFLIASNISKNFGLDLTTINENLPPPEQCIQMIKNHFGQNTVHIPASEILRLRYYSPLYNEKKIVIDGGFGEIARRQYLNKLLFFGKDALLNHDFIRISKYLSHHRAAIFNSETQLEMEKGFLKQVDLCYETMPEVKTFGIENWLDLLAIRTRLASWNGFAQACIDGIGVNYMPFAQPEFLNNVLNLPLKLRKNARLWHDIIRTFQPGLARYPLVKGTMTYPFRLSTKQTMIWAKIKQKLGLYYHDMESVDLIDHLREFIMDMVESEKVKSYPYYDYPSIKNMIENYFSGDKRQAREIDWWLAFELWRSSL